MCQLLFFRLEKIEPGTFEQIGKPHVLRNNRPMHTRNLIRLLFTARYPLVDVTNRRLRLFMALYFVGWFLGFLWLIVSQAAAAGSAA